MTLVCMAHALIACSTVNAYAILAGKARLVNATLMTAVPTLVLTTVSALMVSMSSGVSVTPATLDPDASTLLMIASLHPAKMVVLALTRLKVSFVSVGQVMLVFSVKRKWMSVSAVLAIQQELNDVWTVTMLINAFATQAILGSCARSISMNVNPTPV